MIETYFLQSMCILRYVYCGQITSVVGMGCMRKVCVCIYRVSFQSPDDSCEGHLWVIIRPEPGFNVILSSTQTFLYTWMFVNKSDTCVE